MVARRAPGRFGVEGTEGRAARDNRGAWLGHRAHEGGRSAPFRDGERHPPARHGRGAGGEVRPSRHADGHGGRRRRPVRQPSEIRRPGPVLAGPRQVHPVGRAWLDAALCRPAPDRQCRHDAGRAAQLPPDGRPHRRPSGARPCHGARDHHGAARPGSRQRRRPRHRRAGAGGPLRAEDRRPPHLGDRRRRLPDGRHQPGIRSRWPGTWR